MLAILLNSGMGSRMGALTQNNPKSMVEIAPGKTILSNQIDTLRALGISKFVVTTGYMADLLQAYLTEKYSGVDITYVYNDAYKETNYIVSLLKAAGATQDDVLLLHGDLVFSERAARTVLGASGSTVVVDSTLPIPEKDFKARLSPSGQVREIGTNVFGDDCLACQPFYKLDKPDWLRWQQAIGEFCARGVVTVYAENALNAILESMNLMGLDLKGELCMEVDNEADLNIIKEKLG